MTEKKLYNSFQNFKKKNNIQLNSHTNFQTGRTPWWTKLVHLLKSDKSDSLRFSALIIYEYRNKIIMCLMDVNNKDNLKAILITARHQVQNSPEFWKDTAPLPTSSVSLRQYDLLSLVLCPCFESSPSAVFWDDFSFFLYNSYK